LRAHTLFRALGLYRGQPAILVALAEQDGRTHSELAAMLRIQPATVTKMVRRLEQAGFVTRQPDPDDQRISRVYLTAAARSVHARIAQVTRTLGEETLRGFTPEEIALLRRFLVQMRDNLVRANDG
ncbi:MAG: MarR family transcriptional regulator, partial [Chloroflexi bacterium]|nr:MarR family transcriptional regulator [Chloroflexota bacterium]